MTKAGALLIAAAAALSLAGCSGSSGGSASSSPAQPTSTAQTSTAQTSTAQTSTAQSATATSTAPRSTASSTSSSATSSGAAFCAGLQPHGEGPAEAFTVIPTYSPSQAGQAAKEQLALMAGVATPPTSIAADWSAWRSYLSLVRRDSTKPGAGASLAATLNGPTAKIEPARKKLENYAFAHCK